MLGRHPKPDKKRKPPTKGDVDKLIARAKQAGAERERSRK